MITVASDWSAIGYPEIKRPPQGCLLIGGGSGNPQPPIQRRFPLILQGFKSDQLEFGNSLGVPGWGI
jgi:hypothetical protein